MSLLKGCLYLLAAAAALQAARPSFFARTDYDTIGCVFGNGGPMSIADLNGDGIMDVACDPVLLGNGDGTFRIGPQVPTFSTSLGSYIPLDVNHDGKVDLVFAAYENNLFGVGVLLGNGDGSFQDSPLYYPSTVSDRELDGFGDPTVVGDFNGDGFLDVAILGTSEVILFLGNAQGALIPQTPIFVTYGPGEKSTWMTTADMNQDGQLDLVIDAENAIYILTGNGDGSFRAPVITAVPQNTGFGYMAVGDVNGDGLPDVVLTNDFTPNVAIYPGKGDGMFGTPGLVYLPGSGTAFAIVDVNGDGIQDLVSSGVEIAFGRGHGRYAQPVYYAINQGGTDFLPTIGIADLRNKGKLDILGGSGSLSVLLNEGKGKFEDGIQTPIAGGYAACSASGDFNGDGIPDLAISNNAAIEIYLGTGKANVPFRAGASYPVAVADCPVAGDLNKDGILDLLVPSGSVNGAGSVYGFLGKGDGTFTQGPMSAVPSIGFFALADFNGGGILDYATNTNLLAFGKGDGSFGPPSSFISGTTPYFEIAAGDLNGDGRPDIVLTAFFPTNAVYVLLNQGTTFQVSAINHVSFAGYITLGDVNGHGATDLAIVTDSGVSVYLNNGSGGFGRPVKLDDPMSYGGTAVIADVNGDGITDIAFEGFADAALYLGEGGGRFAAPIYLGTENHSTGLYAMNLHGQNPNKGTPDLVEVDASGVLYTLINQTK